MRMKATAWWAVAYVFGGAFLRRRVQALEVLEPSDEPVSPDHVFLCAAGVEVPEAVRRAASAFARSRQLEAVELVPDGMPTEAAMDLMRGLDPARFRSDIFVQSRCAGHAALVTRRLATRAALPDGPLDPLRFQSEVGRLKHYAPEASDVVIAPGLAAREWPAAVRRALRIARDSDFAFSSPFIVAARSLAMVAAIVMRPLAGLAVALAFSVQPAVTFARTRLVPRDLWAASVGRVVLEPLRHLRTWLHRGEFAEAEPLATARKRYAEELRQGTDRFFEPRRTDCPLCGGADLSKVLTTEDVFQEKPGRFTLDRCASCDHVFQNPRLTIEGLDFYYADFYDGLGEEMTDLILSSATNLYEARADLMMEHGGGGRWLDVGTGHGHFCLWVRSKLDGVVIDGLDMTDAIDEAKRRGWVDSAYRGLFPELAAELAGSYDAVSMSHYLEHTREPRAELDAAWTVLRPGGGLMIEVPDPESFFGTLLTRWWVAWFQPQHQHFLTRRNLIRELEERGFRVAHHDNGRAHVPNNLLTAVLLAGSRALPGQNHPWLPRPTPAARALRGAGLVPVVAIAAVAILVEVLATPLLRRPGRSSVIRVLAVKGPDTVEPSR